MVALIAALLGATFSAPQHPPKIFIDAGVLSAPLWDALELELPPKTLTATQAAAGLWVFVTRKEQLSLRLVAPPKTLIAKEDFSLEFGEAPALRAAVLLIVDAAAALPRPAARVEVIAERPRPAPTPRIELSLVQSFGLGFRLSAQGGWWSQPGGPSPGFSLEAQGLYASLRFGITISASGLGCCRQETQQLSGRMLELSGLLNIEWRILQAGPLGWVILGRAGFRWARFEGRALSRLSDGSVIETTLQTKAAAGAVLQLGTALSVRIWEDLSIFSGVGVELRPGRLVVSSPQSVDDTAIDVGLIGPFAQVGLGLDFF